MEDTLKDFEILDNSDLILIHGGDLFMHDLGFACGRAHAYLMRTNVFYNLAIKAVF